MDERVSGYLLTITAPPTVCATRLHAVLSQPKLSEPYCVSSTWQCTEVILLQIHRREGPLGFKNAFKVTILTIRLLR